MKLPGVSGTARNANTTTSACAECGRARRLPCPRVYLGLIARGRGKEEEAARAFAGAKETVLAETVESPNDAKVLIMRALIDTMLGRTEEAIANGERAAQLLPISADALDGPLIGTNLAAIYAQLGRYDQAFALLDTLVRQIGGPTPGTLRVEPQWDSLRDDPRFQKLLHA